MDFDESDIRSAALCAWKEARGEGADGMRAVLHVLRNRVGFTGFAYSLHDVIYGKNQFTSMSVPSDPEFPPQPDEDDQVFTEALTMAQTIFHGAEPDELPDPTSGAHYYANLHNVSRDGWFYKNVVLDSRSHAVTAQIGRHTFF